MENFEYAQYDGLELADLVRRKEVTAEELLEVAIQRSEVINPKINAISVRHHEYARQQIARSLPEGPFRGVPFLLKDITTLAGTKTTYGSNVYRDYVSDYSSTIADRLVATGVTIFGKTAVPEFGALGTTESRLHGPTRNPWNLAYSAGGSSGGAAAAVAARIVPVAHASDSGGSTRIPASVCGLFGLKPTRARTPVGPRAGLGWVNLVDCPHVISVTVRDSAAMLDAVSGPELTSPFHVIPVERPFLQEVSCSPGRLHIAFTTKSPYGEALKPEIADAVRGTAMKLEQLGHHVEERAPALPCDPVEVGEVINGANLVAQAVRSAEAHFGRSMTDRDLEALTLLCAKNAESGTAIDYVMAEQAISRISNCLRTFSSTCDVFLCPTLCEAPIRIGEINSMSADLDPIRAVRRRVWPMPMVFNMSGQPSMSIPLALHESGLPMGMMFSGRFGDEATLLRLAGQLEQAYPWRSRVPTFLPA